MEEYEGILIPIFNPFLIHIPLNKHYFSSIPVLYPYPSLFNPLNKNPLSGSTIPQPSLSPSFAPTSISYLSFSLSYSLYQNRVRTPIISSGRERFAMKTSRRSGIKKCNKEILDHVNHEINLMLLILAKIYKNWVHGIRVLPQSRHREINPDRLFSMNGDLFKSS